MSFRDRVVLITGGTRGLGLILARQLGAEGARLVIAARDEAEIDAARKELHERRFDVLGIACDLRLKTDVEEMVRRAVQAYGTIDVLINNAGIIQVGPMEMMTEHDYDEAMDVHFWGPLHAIYAVLPLMRARGGGRIINIASIGGQIGVPHLAPYCASKFALVGFSEAITAELRKEGVYVTTVSPGLMRTGSPRNALFKGRHVDEHTWFTLSASLPLISQSADRAAARIIDACRFGEPQLITSLPAAAVARLHAAAPWLTMELSALADRFILPQPGGIGVRRAPGYESESFLTRSGLTALGRSAARRNNEILPSRP